MQKKPFKKFATKGTLSTNKASRHCPALFDPNIYFTGLVLVSASDVVDFTNICFFGKQLQIEFHSLRGLIQAKSETAFLKSTVEMKNCFSMTVVSTFENIL